MRTTRKPSPYQVAQLASRQRADRITAGTLESIIDALDTYIGGVARLARTAKTPQLELIRIRKLQAVRDDLYERLEVSVSSGVQLTARDVRDAFVDAQKDFTAIVQKRGGVFQSLGNIPQAAGFTERAQDILDARQWKTVLRKHVLNADQEVNLIVRRAIAEGMNPKELAKKLRKHVIAADDIYATFGKTLGEKMVEDFRRMPSGYKKYAKQIRYQSERIAFTEIAHARRQAIVNEAIYDPFIRAIRWKRRLVAGRRSKKVRRRPCACDILERHDLYGLGKGVYPVERVPFLPHPFCRCEMVPILSNTPLRTKPQGTLNFNENKLVFSKFATPRAKEAAIFQAKVSL